MSQLVLRAPVVPRTEARPHSLTRSVAQHAVGSPAALAPQGVASRDEHAELALAYAGPSRARVEQETSARTPELIALWDELLAGRWKVTGHLCDDASCRLVLGYDKRPGGSWRTISPKRRSMFESVLLGQAQKVLAIDMGRSASTVSSVLHGCLQTLGLSCQFRNVPLALALFAHATRLNEAVLGASLVREADSCVLTFSRPDGVLRRRLSQVEYDVARLSLEGKSHAQIATLRRTSARTIANQLQSIFSKLNATGRLRLLRLAIDSLPQRPALTAESRHRALG
jgi:DNA-binding CsgD family transcriptional regulator